VVPKIPSGTTTFRIYPTFSDSPNIFRFSQHFQILPKRIFLKVWPFRIYPPPSEFTHHLQNLPTTFRIHPPPS
jgi:hypothetical protein